MQLNITGNNVEITEALREFVTAKFAKLEQYFDRINQVYVVLISGESHPHLRCNTACKRW